MKKIIFIDRDGTLIDEPKPTKQIDSLEKLKLEPFVIPSLLKLKNEGFVFVIVTNQDGLGTDSFPIEDFEKPQNKMIETFENQGITFKDVLICPHLPNDNCECRKPKTKLLLNYIQNRLFDPENSYVIGDRKNDMLLAKNLGIKGILYNRKNNTWDNIARQIIDKERIALVERKTNETDVEIKVNLDQISPIKIDTGLKFFDHMLEQIPKHGNFSLEILAEGDLQVDEHHIIEDVAITLGQALDKALLDKRGIERYGFLLAMDESLAQIAIDLGGRPYLVFEGTFTRDKVGDFPTELVKHFFHSLSISLRATINIKVIGENDHHKIESIFKGIGRSLKMAFKKTGSDLPSTKGFL